MKRCEAFLRGLKGAPAMIHLPALSGDMEDQPERRGLVTVVQNGVAYLSITGPLGEDWCCQTSYLDLQAALARCLADASVTSMALVVDSPGGYTTNAFETAAMIAAAAKVKPICAVVTGVAYSAAYLLASQANKIWLAAPVTGGVGSIGVWTAHADYSEMLAQMGIDVTLIFAGEGKTDGNPYEPLSPEAKAEIKADVDRLYSEFVNAVAKGRSLKPEQVVGLKAKLYDGAAAALASGLVDATGGLPEAVAELARGARSAPQAKGREQMDQTQIDQLVTEARAAGFGQAQEVAELAMVAGVPSRIAEFLQGGKSAKEVRTLLLQEKAAAAGPELKTGSMPGEDTGTKGKQNAQAKPWKDVLSALGARKETK